MEELTDLLISHKITACCSAFSAGWLIKCISQTVKSVKVHSKLKAKTKNPEFKNWPNQRDNLPAVYCHKHGTISPNALFIKIDKYLLDRLRPLKITRKITLQNSNSKAWVTCLSESITGSIPAARPGQGKTRTRIAPAFLDRSKSLGMVFKNSNFNEKIKIYEVDLNLKKN